MNAIAFSPSQMMLSSSSFRFGRAQSTQQYEKRSVTTSAISPSPNLQIGLVGCILPGWKMIRPLLVTIEQDEDQSYLVSDDEFLIYGCGNTQVLAQQDYITSLIEYYQLLEQQHDMETQALFRYLQSYLSPM